MKHMGEWKAHPARRDQSAFVTGFYMGRVTKAHISLAPLSTVNFFRSPSQGVF